MIRAGVIGAGNMGANHARVYAALTGACTLAGVFDPDRDRADAVARRWDVPAFGSVDELLRDVDVVSIASPSSLHFDHAELALRHGVDALVEKPVTHSIEMAQALDELIASDPRMPIVQVGHIEHFNPAIRELRKLVADHEPIAIDMRRLGPFDPRVSDIDVVQDLMLHDIHVLLSIAGAPLLDVSASGRPVHSDATDHAVATLTFADGLIATLCASRITEEKVRRLSVTTADAYITLDSMTRSLQRSRWTSVSAQAGSSGYRQESALERIFVPMEEPLGAQIQSFLTSVRDRSAPEVDVAMGTACLDVVELIRERISYARADLSPAVA